MDPNTRLPSIIKLYHHSKHTDALLDGSFVEIWGNVHFYFYFIFDVSSTLKKAIQMITLHKV